MGAGFLEQFTVKTIVPIPLLSSINIDFTNTSLFMVIATLIIICFLWLSTTSQDLVPGRLQCFGEAIFEFADGLLARSVGNSGASFLPFILTLFAFIITCNMLGLVPGAFTVTSHVAATFCMSATVITVLTICGFKHKGLEFLRVFVPHGIPNAMAPLLGLIEFVAYLFRSVSLALRLSANMIAGHIMIKVVAILGSSISINAMLIWPVLFLLAIIAFEFFVAALQSYIFAMLSCVYLSDAFNKH